MSNVSRCPICHTDVGCVHGTAEDREKGRPVFTGEVDAPKKQVSLLLQCSVTPTDQLLAYVTDMDSPGVPALAVVLTNKHDQKISVVLTRADTVLLQQLINDFIKD